MPRDLAAALCLVVVIEGLVLFAAPRTWQAAMREALKLSPGRLRLYGAAAIVAGLLILRLVH